MKGFASILFTLAAMGAFAVPSATVKSVSCDASTGLVTVDYTLDDGPAIVTFGVSVDGEAVARKALRSAAGDINCKVAKKDCRFYWQPRLEGGAVVADAGKLAVTLNVYRPGLPPDYLVADLSNEKVLYYYETEDDLPYGIESPAYRRNLLVMRKIPAAGKSFVMGSPKYFREGNNPEVGRKANETQQVVSFTNDYYMAVFELTKAQYFTIQYAVTEGSGKMEDLVAPVRSVGYEGQMRGWRDHGYKWPQTGHDVAAWYVIDVLRSRTGLLIDLPTEAQWEFAARAGSTTALPDNLSPSVTDNDENTGIYAWYGGTNGGNSGGVPHPVGLKKPNAWGLYDVLGNVAEMCLDVYADDITGFGEIDPKGLETDERTNHLMRGGDCTCQSQNSRFARRVSRPFSGSPGPDLGVRLWAEIPQE